MTRAVEESNRRLLRARDAMDRTYAQPLDVATLARIAHVSEAHFIRSFRATFGETPHRYLQRRRVERAMFLLRATDRSVTDVCMEVGFSSLGTFSRTFHEIVGEAPTTYRRRGKAPAVPTCSVDEASADRLRELITKGAAGWIGFSTDDCRTTFEELRAKGVEFTQEPVEQDYGTDCALRDPFGNAIRIVQPAAMPG